MRKKAFMLAFIILGIVPVSWGQSVYIGSSDFNTVSVEIRTIKKKKEFIQAWAEYNDSNITSKSASFKVLMRVRCEEEEMATASTVRYSKPFGMGEVVSSANQNYPSYSPVVPNSIGESILRFVCAYQAGESWALKAAQESIDGEAAADSAAAAADAAAKSSKDYLFKKDIP